MPSHPLWRHRNVSWNLSSCKTAVCLPCIVNAVIADVLAIQGARTSATTVFTYLSCKTPCSTIRSKHFEHPMIRQGIVSFFLNMLSQTSHIPRNHKRLRTLSRVHIQFAISAESADELALLHMISVQHYTAGLVQDCRIPSALAMEILQSCTKPLISCFPGLYRLSRYT